MKGRKLSFMGVISALVLLASACEIMLPPAEGENGKVKVQKTLIVYSCGHNNLSVDLLEDLADLSSNAPNEAYTDSYRLLIFSHRAENRYNYKVPVDPVLMQVYKDQNDMVVYDTVKVFPSKTYANGTPSEEGYSGSDAKTLKEVMSYIKTEFPSLEYGMLFSSHATGWLPYDYYDTGKITKSVGADYSGQGSKGVPIEIELADFASAIDEAGMHFHYMIFDACFMGGIEAAYELRHVCRYFMASPTEIWSGGLMYKDMIKRLMGSKEPDFQGMCDSYIEHYKSMGATISLTDCSKLDDYDDSENKQNIRGLSTVCRDLFTKHAALIAKVNPNNVQGYHRQNTNFENQKHYFYDMRDILVQAGVPQDDLDMFDTAINNAVIIKGHTENLIDGLPCKTFCGLSMYLPCAGNAELNEYYKRYQWNTVTGLVK